MPMTVYQAEWCPFSRRLRQRLTELGVEWLAVPVEAEPPDRDAMREATGTDIIPVVVLGDGTVLGGDTEDIIAELDERIPEPATAEGHKLAAAMH
ncbi:MAG: glutaredoxin 3 [Solirubrobacteraceae bacterium]|nr:glutaredoxin 3 [Solirubrobacteraceae bacterium]